jgi:hypothetical protein
MFARHAGRRNSKTEAKETPPGVSGGGRLRLSSPFLGLMPIGSSIHSGMKGGRSKRAENTPRKEGSLRTDSHTIVPRFVVLPPPRSIVALGTNSRWAVLSTLFLSSPVS